MTVSRGLYQYLCNGEASGIEETWECHEQGDERCIESVRYARPVGIVIRVDSTERGGRFSHCRIHMRRELSTGPMEISADYCFEDSGLRVHVHDGFEETELRETRGDFVFSPLMRIFNGPVILALLESGGRGQVMVPWIKDPNEAGQLLRPHFSDRAVELIGDKSTKVDGRPIPCREYDYSGGEYPPGTRFWVDEHNVMLRYCFQQDRNTLWEVSLRDYQT